jgi:hypothetical protein
MLSIHISIIEQDTVRCSNDVTAVSAYIPKKVVIFLKQHFQKNTPVLFWSLLSNVLALKPLKRDCPFK